jgi:hypothetical protein
LGLTTSVATGPEVGAILLFITLDTYSYAIPALQERAAALIAGPVFVDQ